MLHTRLDRGLRVLPTAVLVGLLLIAPVAANSPETDPGAQCGQGSGAAPGGENANSGKSTPQAVSHDLRTNVVARADMSPSPVSTSPVAANACDHAINTKGTGTSGRATGGGDCDDSDSAPTAAPDTNGPGAAERTDTACLAIKTKGTSAK